MIKRSEKPPEDDKNRNNNLQLEENYPVDETEFSVGCKLEARDNQGAWYPAKVEEIDWTGKEVLVHYDRFRSKYNEWISMSSPRLRSVTKPAPKKPPPTFERGQQVLASWSTYRYPAVVQRALPDGKYEVLYEDGCVKRLLPSKMWHVEDSSSSLRTSEVDIGSKQDRRDRKRKLVVSELFRSNKRPKSLSGSDPNEKRPVPTTSSSTVAETPHLETPPRKPLPPMPHVPPMPIEVSYLDGHKETWTKMLTRRSEGKTAGKIEIVICSATGRKFRARAEIIRYCEENKIQYEPKLFDFSAKGRPKAKSAMQTAKEQVDESSTAALQNVPEPTPITPACSTKPQMNLSIPIGEPEEEERRFIGDLEVIMEDGQFICPVAECRKHFRKENLLHMHMKHYHPELSKYLDYTPSVTDLAYARTVSNLQQDIAPGLKTAARPDLRSMDVKRSPIRMKDCRVEVKQLSVKSAESLPVATTPDISDGPKPDTDSDGVPAQNPSLVEVGLDLAPPEAMTECGREVGGVGEGELDNVIPTGPLHRPPRPHWKRRPYHRNQLPVPDWYGRMGKQQTSGTSSEGLGKQKGESAGLVQRNPILNTLLSSRPLAPTLGWRAGWRRRRRGGWNRRRPPRTSAPSLAVPLTLSGADGVDDKSALAAEGKEISKSPAQTDSEKFEKLRGNEIINCTCQVKEEDGLMIQCDVCQCWQHGHCLGITPQADGPESYVCSICKDPPKGRSSRKYYNHQDWLKQGVLPSLPFKPKQPSQRQVILKRAFEMSGQLSLMSRLLHSLRVKLSVSGNKDHPKLWLWARKWQETHKTPNPVPDIKEEEPSTPKAPEPEKPIDPVECKLNLLDHIQHYHNLVQERLNALEAQIKDLEEMQDDASQEDLIETRTSATIKMLLRDLDTVKRVAALP